MRVHALPGFESQPRRTIYRLVPTREVRAMPFARRTEEEKAAKAAQKEADREAKARDKLRRAFYDSPAGDARLAFEAGAQVFQYEADVKATKAVVRPIFLGGGAK